MKKTIKNKFIRIGFLLFIVYLFMNAPFMPKYDFLSGICAGTGFGFMIFGMLDEEKKLTKNKKCFIRKND